MREELDKEKLLNEAIPPNIQERGDVIRYMLDNKFVSNTFLKDLQIFYLYKKERRCEGVHSSVLNVSVKTGFSERKVYSTKKRFKKRRSKRFEK